MKNILSLESQRILKIASSLVLSRESTTYQDLQRQNKSTYETLCQDLLLIEEKYADLLDLNSENGKLFSKTKSLSSLEQIKQRELKNDLKVQVLLQIYFDPDKDLFEYGQALGENEEAIQDAVLHLNAYLSKYQLKIINSQGLRLVSLEGKSLRRIFFMTDLLYLLRDYQDFIPELDFSYLEEAFFKDVSLPWVMQEYIALAYQIKAFDAIKYGDLLSQEDLFKSFASDYGRKMNQFFEEQWQSVWEDSIKAKMSPLNLEKILLLMAYREHVLVSRVDDLFNRYDYFYQNFKKESPRLSEQYESFLVLLEESVHLSLYEYASELMFVISTQIISPKEDKRYQIAIFSDLGLEHAYALASVISQHFPMHEVQIYEERDMFYDLCISTTDVKSFANCRNCVTVSDYPSVFDFKKIYESLYFD